MITNFLFGDVVCVVLLAALLVKKPHGSLAALASALALPRFKTEQRIE